MEAATVAMMVIRLIPFPLLKTRLARPGEDLRISEVTL
jgi:hypothetical protein